MPRRARRKAAGAFSGDPRASRWCGPPCLQTPMQCPLRSDRTAALPRARYSITSSAVLSNPGRKVPGLHFATIALPGCNVASFEAPGCVLGDRRPSWRVPDGIPDTPAPDLPGRAAELHDQHGPRAARGRSRAIAAPTPGTASPTPRRTSLGFLGAWRALAEAGSPNAKWFLCHFHAQHTMHSSHFLRGPRA
jgi:hypothetical protein